MSAPLQARMNALEETTRTHKRELDTLREVDRALLGVVERAVDKVELVNQGFVQFGADVARRFEQIDARLDRLETSTNARFDRVDARFDQVEIRFNNLDTRFTNLETRFTDVEHLLRDISRRLPEPADSAG